jgi:hypothetical protein
VRTFRDQAGDEWALNITIGSIIDLKDRGLDLEAIIADEGRPLFETEVLAKAVILLTRKQFKKRGLTIDQFEERFDGDTLDRAFEMVEAEINDFFRLPLLHRKLKAAVEGMHRAFEPNPVDWSVFRTASRQRSGLTRGLLPSAN